jgi:hypothetical protein
MAQIIVSLVEVREPDLVDGQEDQHVNAATVHRTSIESLSRRLPARIRIRFCAMWIVRTQDDQFRLRLIRYVTRTGQTRMNLREVSTVPRFFHQPVSAGFQSEMLAGQYYASGFLAPRVGLAPSFTGILLTDS